MQAELAQEQVKKVTVAKQLGTLSLAVRAAVDQWDKADTGAMSSCDVSPELARQYAIARQRTAVVIHSGGEAKQYTVRKQDEDALVSCEGASEVVHQTATAEGYVNRVSEKR